MSAPKRLDRSPPSGPLLTAPETVDTEGSGVTELTLAEECIFYVRDAPDEAPITIDLPLEVGGVTPTTPPVGSSVAATRLLVEITAALNRSDGSAWTVGKVLLAYIWDDNDAGYRATEIQQEDDTTDALASIVLAGTTNGGTPNLPRLTLSQGGSSGSVRYMLSVCMRLIMVPGPLAP